MQQNNDNITIQITDKLFSVSVKIIIVCSNWIEGFIGIVFIYCSCINTMVVNSVFIAMSTVQ